jgi:hypothetical protein
MLAWGVGKSIYDAFDPNSGIRQAPKQARDDAYKDFAEGRYAQAAGDALRATAIGGMEVAKNTLPIDSIMDFIKGAIGGQHSTPTPTVGPTDFASDVPQGAVRGVMPIDPQSVARDVSAMPARWNEEQAPMQAPPDIGSQLMDRIMQQYLEQAQRPDGALTNDQVHIIGNLINQERNDQRLREPRPVVPTPAQMLDTRILNGIEAEYELNKQRLDEEKAWKIRMDRLMALKPNAFYASQGIQVPEN